MSYQVKQKIRGKIYVYEAEGVWDKEKKQARQKRKYLGVLNEKTGEIDTPRKEKWSKRTQLASGVVLAVGKCAEKTQTTARWGTPCEASNSPDAFSKPTSS